jgi:hypothetical protein
MNDTFVKILALVIFIVLSIGLYFDNVKNK